jgi:hypothetical protein
MNKFFLYIFRFEIFVNFAVFWVCFNLNFEKQKYFWDFPSKPFPFLYNLDNLQKRKVKSLKHNLQSF